MHSPVGADPDAGNLIDFVCRNPFALTVEDYSAGMAIDPPGTRYFVCDNDIPSSLERRGVSAAQQNPLLSGIFYFAPANGTIARLEKVDSIAAESVDIVDIAMQYGDAFAVSARNPVCGRRYF
jgi:hypothetical protein